MSTAKLVPIIALVLVTASLFLGALALRADEDAKARQQCMDALVRPAMPPDDPAYGEAWIAYSSDVKLCVGMP